jgi:hypothetical protein
MPPKLAMLAAWLEKAKEGETGTMIHSPAVRLARKICGHPAWNGKNQLEKVRRNKPNVEWKNRKSRNSCSVKIGDKNIGGMMTLRKFGALVLD